jgi:hypothetical protein
MSEDNSQPAPANILAIISSAFAKICLDQVLRPKLWNKWLPAEIWVEALTKANRIDEALTFNVRNFNTAMARSKSEFNGLLIERFDGSNTTGVFRLTFQKRKYYYVTNQNTQVLYPKPLDTNWKKAVLDVAKGVLSIRALRSNTAAPTTAGCTDVVSTLEGRKRQFLCDDEITPQMPYKRHNTDNTLIAIVGPSCNVVVGGATSTVSPNLPEYKVAHAEQVLLPKMFYWNSRDASNLFGVKLERPEDDVRDALRHRIKLLQSVSQDHNGWRNVIEG